MHLSRLHRVRLTWLVSFTILLAALLPTLSHAFVSAAPGTLAEICSATGARFLSAPTGDTSSQPGKSTTDASVMSCPCCALHQGALSLPPAMLTWVPSAALKFERPLLFFLAPSPLFAWTCAHARAPPMMA
jgi:hypothetical protein